ncbi:MAG: response regulator [Cyanobacteriota bacterium]|nr:response regulator [Cyanobacteriota bacterium]
MSTILVVEDSPAQRTMIVNLLKHHGMDAIEAKGGAEALQYMQTKCPDLVILDIIMPNPNGYDICRNIKRNSATQHVPVVMCSCKGEEFDRYWGMKMGADAYVAKPFHPDELMSAVKQLLTA